MSPTKRILLIGSGTMAQTHSEAYRKMDNVQVTGIVDIRKEMAERLAETYAYPVPVMASLAEAVNAVPCDVVDVCVPTNLHRDMVVEAAGYKKHVICEKPMARSLEEAREMIDACEKAGVRLFVGHVVRYFPNYVDARARILSGEIGQVGTVRTFRGGEFPSATEDWYASTEKSGGPLLDLVIHDFDYLRWVFGEVERVYAKALTGRDAGRIDHAFVSLRFENGVIANIEGSWAEVSGFYTEFEFAGTEGMLIHDSRNETPLRLSLRSSESANGAPTGVAVPESPMNYSPYYLELEDFLRAIDSGAPARVTTDDAVKALEMSFAAIESLRTGEAVTMGVTL